MDALSHSDKKQNILMSLPLLALWMIGLWVLRKKHCSMAADAAVTAWYFSLSLIFSELFFQLRLLQTGSHTGVWLAVLSLLWAIRSGMAGSRPLPALFPLLNRIGGIHAEYLSAVLTPILLLSFFLSLKKDWPDYPRQALFPAMALAVPACIWEPARFTLSLCFLAAALYSVSREISKAREEKLLAISEVEMLSELNRMKNQSYADLAHEMKTPLTVISVNAQLAAMNLESGMPDEETVTDVRIISAEASRLTQMVTGFVGLGQLRGTGIGRATLSSDTLIRTTARTCQALSARYNNTLTVTTEPDLPPVFGNADRLTQVLFNLINNANRHTREGSVSISAKALEDWIEVSVADNGEGIDPGLLPHVFERFCRGDKGETGLGLPICKKIIGEHGGEMGIESEVGKGTRVWFRLPIHNGGYKKDG